MAYEDLIKRLSIEQKCALLAGATAFGSREISSAGISKLEFSDGPHGLRHQAAGANHLGVGDSLPATCFPTAVTLANSWDQPLSERVGAALGEEAAAQGVNVLLGPGVCIKRSPLCGRNFEYFSEDPYVAGKMAAAYVRGVQSAGVAACVKHFAANSQETRRQASDSVLDERTLREIYLRAFEIVVREARPLSIMSSYNLVNGTYANENAHLLQEILRDEWGFDGAVVTDWGGSNDHVAGVRAGSTLEMPAPGLDSTRQLLAALKDGSLAESDVDVRVEEVLRLVFSTRDAVASSPDSFDVEAHHRLAREAAAAGVVLLKNEPPAPSSNDGEAAPVLPLPMGARVALIGDFAKAPRYQGAGSSLVNCTKLDTLLDAIGESGLNCVGFEPGFDRNGGDDPDKLQAALSLAAQADVLLVSLGLSEAAESEGLDRSTLALDAIQLRLLQGLAAVNPRIVVLLSAGGVVETDWARDVPAVLYLGLGGQAGASAALDVVTGRVNPSGKLTETWVRKIADCPTAKLFPSDEFTSEYREGLYVGYRYFATTGHPVAFPFGFGLSYTTFSYSNLVVSPDGRTVGFTLSNTGERDGAEIAQVYVGKHDRSVFGPALQLAGFAKVVLPAGSSREVSVSLDPRAYQYFNVQTNAWETEGGAYEVYVGSSSTDLPLSALVQMNASGAPNPYAGLSLPSYLTGEVGDVSQGEFEALLGRPVPQTTLKIDRNMCFRDVGHARSPLFWLLGAILRLMVRRTDAHGRPNLNALFIYNMPMRALAKNMGAFISMGLVDAIVRELKGWGLLGIVPALILRGALGWNVPLVWFLWFALPLVGELALNVVRNARDERRLASDRGRTV